MSLLGMIDGVKFCRRGETFFYYRENPLPLDHIWSTDLDWLVPRHDRLVVLRFLAGGSANSTLTAQTTPAPYLHPAAQIRAYLEEQEPWFPISPEFANYALASIVYAVRYPAVFWNTNKTFAFIFSLQLFANALQVNGRQEITSLSSLWLT